MNKAYEYSMRMLFDLQACQTQGSAQRGVGRYSKALYLAIESLCFPRDIFALVSDNHPSKVEFKGISSTRILHLPELPSWDTARDFEGGNEDSLDSTAYSAFAQTISPDIIHVSHAFEGYADRVALPQHTQRSAGQVLSVTLYDLIPLVFKEYYFQDRRFKKWFLARLNWLRQADLLLAISESTKKDAIQLLGIKPERIVVIHGGIADHFKPPENLEVVRQDLTNRYSLRERFVLYAGGDDYRKNIRGLIEGFSKISPEVRTITQLVIVCLMSDDQKQMYLDIANCVGLNDNDILFPGYISERDLVAFYSTCDIFVFPSLYEGLGLPVLEAMACGAPVIGGDNSSLRELIERKDALFDANAPSSIGECISKVLTDHNFNKELRKYGLERSKEFSWDQSAMLALEAFDDAYNRKHKHGLSSAISGWVPRKKLAVLTPLPPCRSGIADYNAKFLPFLSRHFDIDLYVDNYKITDDQLTAAFPVYDVKDFESVAESYDAILYEFGNSEFHNHMVSLLEKFPGVVGLHDAYLSGMFGYFEFYLGQSGYYQREMLLAHGSRARRFFAPIESHPDPVGASMVELPCTKRVLDSAIGIISHSPFNLAVASENFAEGWRAPYRTIKQMVLKPRPVTPEALLALRQELGFSKDDIVITTFGHIAWTKWSDRLLEAIIQSPLSENSHVFLIFAGDISKDEFGIQLKEAAKKSGLGNRIRITGYLTDTDYEKYLRVTDIGVQLRTKSRGGTPKGVLDCLAYGVPVIVNNEASYRDYPDDVVIKLAPDPLVSEISNKILDLIDTPYRLAKYAREGLHYIEKNHHPEICAAEYAVAIHEFMKRREHAKPLNLVKAFAPGLATCKNIESAKISVKKWLSNMPVHSFKRRRLFIDVSHIAQSDPQTGISKVVKEIVRALYCIKRPGFEPVAVVLNDGNLVFAQKWLDSLGLLLPHEITDSNNETVVFKEGDILLMLDSSWAIYTEFHSIFKSARLAHVPVITAVYDLLPLKLPVNCIVDGGREWFRGWFHDAISSSDGLVCISRAVADEIIDYLKQNSLQEEIKGIGYWHLGSNFKRDGNLSISKRYLKELKSTKYLLMVGTIEPRKCHALALEAMEKLWKDDFELSLCIVGKEGWMVEPLMERLRTHSLLGKRLFLFERAYSYWLISRFWENTGQRLMAKV